MVQMLVGAKLEPLSRILPVKVAYSPLAAIWPCTKLDENATNGCYHNILVSYSITSQ